MIMIILLCMMLAGLASELAEPLQHMTFDTEPGEADCPEGMEWAGRACADVDECAFDAPCQHRCENRRGSFQCFCPAGYVLDEFGQCLGECTYLNKLCSVLQL